MSKFTPRLMAALSGVVLALAGAFTLAGSPAAAATTAHCERYAFYPSGQSLCDKFPGNTKRDCTKVKYKVALLNANIDPWHLDRDGDGMGCESNPNCPNPYPTATHTSTPTTAPTTTAPTTKPTTAPTTSAPETTAPTTAPTSVTASVSRTTTAPAPGAALPLTGPGAPMIVAAGTGLLLAGIGLLVWLRQRRTTRFAA